VGNEGFLIALEDRKVLVDALYRDGVPGYVIHPPARRNLLEEARPPFDGVDVVLATHFHADHFDPSAVAAHLSANPEAIFISTPQAVALLRRESGSEETRARVREVFPAEGERTRIEHAGLSVTAINLHHGRSRPIQNLGYIIEIGGRRLLHVGDSEADREDLGVYGLEAEAIEIGLIPYWYLTGDDFGEAVRKSIRPRTLVPIHVPAPDAPDDYFGVPGGQNGLFEGVLKKFPGAVLFREEMETRVFPGRSVGSDVP
jgi:L-ascorbate metabolism protein UlaG (beta-lactamase superfamily)